MKILYGGRGGAKSWSIARALLVLGAQRPIRVLCARELQNSISESVHKTLADQVETMGLQSEYTVQAAQILGRNGTSFSFIGIKNNPSKVRSYEGVDYCWVEEANSVSKASWKILVPTIRKQGSEIWVSFNPELDSDYTYKRYVTNPDLRPVVSGPLAGLGDIRESENSLVVKLSWRDNPWFTDTLRREMEDDNLSDYDTYLNVWEGHPIQILDGVVYAKQLRELQADERITYVPWHPASPVNTYWDLGRSDATSIWFAQRVGMQWRVLSFFEGRGDDITFYLQELASRRYIYGTHYLPHDARAKHLGSKKSIEELVRAAYPGKVQIVPRIGLVDGINIGRLTMRELYFDQNGCADGLQALRKYRYKVVNGQYSREPEHDENSHAADAYRYMAISMRGAPATGAKALLRKLGRKTVRAAGGAATGASLGWMNG